MLLYGKQITDGTRLLATRTERHPAPRKSLKVAVQKAGTFAWELAVIRPHSLDKQKDLAIQVNELENQKASKIALRGGAADIIISDYQFASLAGRAAKSKSLLSRQT